jgi:hypothetical protein
MFKLDVMRCNMNCTLAIANRLLDYSGQKSGSLKLPMIEDCAGAKEGVAGSSADCC